MADFGFIGPSYEAPSIYQDAQELINWYGEVDPNKAQGERGIVALYPTPGLTMLMQLAENNPVRGMRTVSGGLQMVAVVGAYVYVINQDFTYNIVGILNSVAGRVGITDNGLNVYIVDGAFRYTWRISSPATAVFVGSISGTTLTVSSVTNGKITVGQAIYGVGTAYATVITALGTGTGGTGTYTLNNSQTVTSQTLTGTLAGAVITASIGHALTGVAITGTAGQFSCTAASQTLVVGQTITISGTFGGTGSITGYTNPTTYYIVATNGSTTFTLSTTSGGTGVVTTAGTPTVLTYSVNNTTMTVTAVTGTLYPGQTIQGTGLASTTIITALGTGTGSTGTYTVNNAQSLTSRTMYALNFTQIPTTDGAFSGGGTIDIMDNYFIYNRPGTQQFAASDALSPITRALSFSSKDGAPDNLVSLIVDHREVYLLGERSSEVWTDVGSFPFAFQRIPGTSTQHGIAAQFTMARLGNSFAYVSRNDRGQGQVVMMNGYVPQRISTHAVENSIKDQPIDDAIAWSYQLEGHEFYVVTFPSVDLTWSYDTSTGMWNKWLWVDSENVYHRHRGNCSALFQGLILVGDWENGKIYQLDPENYTDDEGPIRRLRRCPHLVTDFFRQYFSTLQIQFQPGVGLSGITQSISNSAIAGIAIAGLAVAGTSGTEISNVNPKAMLRWSNDGGSTWSNERWVGIGEQGKYQNRAIWRRLGYARDRVFEVVVTDPVKAVIVSADLMAEAGVN
jgi:hypothetical protein